MKTRSKKEKMNKVNHTRKPYAKFVIGNVYGRRKVKGFAGEVYLYEYLILDRAEAVKGDRRMAIAEIVEVNPLNGYKEQGHRFFVPIGKSVGGEHERECLCFWRKDIFGNDNSFFVDVADRVGRKAELVKNYIKRNED